MNKLIGVGGYKRSGKDTICNLLVEQFDYTKLAFADNLRVMCAKVFDIHLSTFTSDEFKERLFMQPIAITNDHLYQLSLFMFEHHRHLIKGVDQYYDLSVKIRNWDSFIGLDLMSPRHVLQIVGTDLIRNHIQASYHADVVFDIVKSNPDKKYCISDCRFPNERTMVKDGGGITLMVSSSTDDTSNSHASEKAIGTVGDYDYCFTNEKDGIDKLKVEFAAFVDVNLGENNEAN